MTETPENFPDMMDTHQVARCPRVKERKIYDLSGLGDVRWNAA